jgi:hypothetical protein
MKTARLGRCNLNQGEEILSMQCVNENRESSGWWTVGITRLIFTSCLLLAWCDLNATGQIPENSSKCFEKDGLAFGYTESWELSDQSNPAAQQLVLMEKALDAQIMITVLRGVSTSAKQEEQAKAALVEPSISRLLSNTQTRRLKSNAPRRWPMSPARQRKALSSALRLMVSLAPPISTGE